MNRPELLIRQSSDFVLDKNGLPVKHTHQQSFRFSSSRFCCAKVDITVQDVHKVFDLLVNSMKKRFFYHSVVSRRIIIDLL